MKVLIILALAAAASLAGAGVAHEQSGGGDEAVNGVAGVSPGIVEASTARELVAAGVKVVDVRTPAEFEAGHVPGAVNIPFDEMPQRAGEIGPPSTPVLLYCSTGRRSGIATETLRQQGFTKIYDLQSYDRWVASERAQSAGR